MAFSPDGGLHPSQLNLWQGFAVQPLAGDAAPWLEVLEALVPIESERIYVRKWLAWKVQHPGGVPDTILIFRGAKGAGKNSLFEPMLDMFGPHSLMTDDPEQIAGRFTWHLMNLSFAVLDEAVFAGDPRQMDRIKSRVTAKSMMYEQKGFTPVSGVNRCAYVMLTNRLYVWQATNDERRAVVLDVGDSLVGRFEFWKRYNAWLYEGGAAALLHYLQSIDLAGFDPRLIPKGEALRKQVEQTALRDPLAAWWSQCLTDGEIRWRDGSMEMRVMLEETAEVEISVAGLCKSFEQSAAARGRVGADARVVGKRLKKWAAGMRKSKPRVGLLRENRYLLPSLNEMRVAFAADTQIDVSGDEFDATPE